jgi:hypothetical protein
VLWLGLVRRTSQLSCNGVTASGWRLSGSQAAYRRFKQQALGMQHSLRRSGVRRCVQTLALLAHHACQKLSTECVTLQLFWLWAPGCLITMRRASLHCAAGHAQAAAAGPLHSTDR